MASQVEIFNMALLHTGCSNTLAAVTDNTKEAKLCRVFFDMCRDAMLREVSWPFARKRLSLALLADDPPTNWGYAYAYPTDCLKALTVVSSKRVPRYDEQPPFEVCRVGTTKAICTDVENAELIYTATVGDAGQFDPLFAEALTYLLASKIAMSLSSIPGMSNQLRQLYQLTLSQAAAQAFNEAHEGPEPESAFLAVRL